MNTGRIIVTAIIGSLVAALALIPGSFGTSGSAISSASIGAATLEATAEGTASVDSAEPACIKRLLSGTAEATDATVEPTLDSTDDSTTATLESTIAATSANTALSYLTLEPFDVRFNPNPDKAFAVVMNFTLFIQNNLESDLSLQRPKFNLSIDNVPWTDVASTDFQMGTLQGNARHGIVLQTLTLINKTNEAQKQVLDCIKAKIPVDLHLTGTLEMNLNGKIELAEADVIVRQAVLPVSN